MDLGSLGEWLNALIAACALFLAWQAGKQAKQLYQNDRRREREQQALRQKQDAVRFSVWIAAEKGKIYSWGIVLNNVSERPLYNLVVCGDYAGKHGERVPFAYSETRLLPPGRFFIPKNCDDTLPYAFKYPEIYDENKIQPLLVTKKHRIISVSFTDSDGLQWQADDKGNLQRTNPT
ncbi:MULTISPECIES: hypothetical protein [Neisseria]|uniref:Uncharacterized protein n=1 Tax=Neisseria musculi TaxID=1815583 RepID=A0A7H1M9B6_9NEIS|nr:MULTISPECIES: hypothetical protein [Neisseria]MBF0803791.1 hypothetical protein [Neisseria sp. 19428wB4_WF04]QNT58231.1 hypothetical protein H7A79_1855 [Neisseria musculi]TFU43534.1 hypothetical protein E4T99_05395 [Neisseria sp. WF04]